MVRQVALDRLKMAITSVSVIVCLLLLTVSESLAKPLLPGIRSALDSSTTFTLSHSSRGSSFFSGGYWQFWTQPDPTHGSVNYLSQQDAQSQGLVGLTSAGQVFARASDTDIGAGVNRASVRFESTTTYDSALIVFDVVKMPIGCGTWPALWTYDATTWPHHGEIDVMEGIGYTSAGANANLVSGHFYDDSVNTAPESSYTGHQDANNCKTDYAAGQNGCSIQDINNHGPSWGQSFNNAGGGIWAVQFGNGRGIKVWFWSRGQQPSSLTNNAQAASNSLDTSTFGEPMANFQSTTIDNQLRQQTLVVDCTIGGDWAGNEPLDGQCAGEKLADALQKGSNYADAEFIFNGIDVYT